MDSLSVLFSWDSHSKREARTSCRTDSHTGGTEWKYFNPAISLIAGVLLPRRSGPGAGTERIGAFRPPSSHNTFTISQPRASWANPSNIRAPGNLAPQRSAWAHCTSHMMVFFAALALFGVTQARADVHPVPLDKDTPPAKCLECHVDQSKGKSVHSAMAMGCTACHEVRVNKDVTRVKLITTTPSRLCLT